LKGNRLREVLSSGKVALGAGVASGSPEVIEAIGRADLDYVWLDLQHQNFGPYDSDRLGNLVRAAETTGTCLLVRVPFLQSSVIGKVLDAGVSNVLVPEVANQEEVSRAISAAKFNADAGFGHRSVPLSKGTAWVYLDEDMLKEIDGTTMIGIMIEQKSLVDGLGTTISLKGVDFVYLGFNDLSLSLGLPLNRKSRVLDDYENKILQHCMKAGIPIGRTAASLETASKSIREGYKLLTLGFDVLIFQQHLDEFARQLRSFS